MVIVAKHDLILTSHDSKQVTKDKE